MVKKTLNLHFPFRQPHDRTTMMRLKRLPEKLNANCRRGHGSDITSPDQFHVMFALHDFRDPPRLNQPQVISAPLQTMDITPSLLAILNVSDAQAESRFSGFSLLPIINGNSREAKWIIEQRAYRFLSEGLRAPLKNELFSFKWCGNGNCKKRYNSLSMIDKAELKKIIRYIELDKNAQPILKESNLAMLQNYRKRAVIWKQWQLTYIPDTSSIDDSSHPPHLFSAAKPKYFEIHRSKRERDEILAVSAY